MADEPAPPERPAGETAAPQGGEQEKRSGAGRIIGIVATSIVALIGVGLLLGGIALMGLHAFARDDDGFYSTETEKLKSRGYAITTEEVDLSEGEAGFDVEDLAATVRLEATGETGKPVFIGIADRDDVERYLAGVAYSEVTDFDDDGEPEYDPNLGRVPPPAPPADRDFWEARSEGTGTQRIEWELESGNWTAVAMNADASRGVAVEVDAGAKVSWLIWVGLGLAIFGLLVAGVALLAVMWLINRGRWPEAAGPPG